MIVVMLSSVQHDGAGLWAGGCTSSTLDGGRASFSWSDEGLSRKAGTLML
jgi:hypothetical protein